MSEWVKYTARALLVVLLIGGVGATLLAPGQAHAATVSTKRYAPPIDGQSIFGKLGRFVLPFIFILTCVLAPGTPCDFMWW